MTLIWLIVALVGGFFLGRWHFIWNFKRQWRKRSQSPGDSWDRIAAEGPQGFYPSNAERGTIPYRDSLAFFIPYRDSLAFQRTKGRQEIRYFELRSGDRMAGLVSLDGKVERTAPALSYVVGWAIEDARYHLERTDPNKWEVWEIPEEKFDSTLLEKTRRFIPGPGDRL